ncbi:hypothetical protein LTR62_003456 [Meristemomyces frigidus]|uniref:GA4 desaturase n=1 Tax=Meristemomyces frigidus TaxID=1508187 RepID=A0AAN7TKG1_9PEZI|nr:hypothetical protein LTR62_003456 [Meristemomyces frigidus]
MATMTLPPIVEARINYFPPDGPRIFYPGTAGYQRRVFDTQTIQVNDTREAQEDLTLDKCGFQVVHNDWTPIDPDGDPEHIRKVVYSETIDFLKKLTGATEVIPFSNLVRKDTAEQVSQSGEGLNDSDPLPAAGPTRFAHCDNSTKGALTVLEAVAPDAERRMKSRWAIMNVWRGIRTVTRDPLGMLHAQSVTDSELIGVFSAFPQKGSKGAFGGAYEAGEGFETAQVKAGQGHRWYYCSNMQPHETLVFKQYDSKLDGRATRTPHSAFQTKHDSGLPRQSIEVRNLVFWDGESPE